MRKNDPCFCLVFGKANQSGLLFLIRQANFVRNNPISFSRNADMQRYVCVPVQQSAQRWVFLYTVSYVQPCLAISLSVLTPPLHHFCFSVLFPSSSDRLFRDTGDTVVCQSCLAFSLQTFFLQTATLLSPSCLMQVSMAPVFAAPSSLSSKDTSNHNFPKAQYPAQNCSSPAE